ncbi:MAG: hypothetical protein IIZ35_03615, partial [Clostridia bacterium]|nr:hypothetical protein [Clostridia bacterium]
YFGKCDPRGFMERPSKRDAPFSVYPAPDGSAYETLHLAAFTEALYDLRAMSLLESLAGYDAVMEILEDGIEPITFDEYPRSDEYILNTRERINQAIKAHLEK